MSTVLCIGGNSVIAQAVLPRLKTQATVITAGRKGCDVYCDLTQEVVIPAGVDTIINFAAHFGGTDDDDIEAALQTNVMGVWRLCRAAQAAGVQHIVQLSTIFTYAHEGSPAFSIYALTKRHSDELLRYYAGLHGLQLTILRPSRIYGDSDAFAPHQPFLYQLADQAQKGDDITLYGDHDAQRNYIHSEDVAAIIARVTTTHRTGTFDLVYPENTTHAAMAAIAQEVFGSTGAVRRDSARPPVPDDDFPITHTHYEQIGYTPQITMRVGMQRIKAYRERGNQ
jgi:nucleoside-diphosphate-sugar epimerase